MYWYQKLIETKDRIAYKSMAELARYVVNSEDYAKSLAMAQEASEAGEWESMVYLAECYKYGQGVAADPVKAKYWMDKVVEVTGCEQALDHLDDEADDSGILDEQPAVHAGNQPPKTKTGTKKQSVKVKKGTLQKTRKSTTAIKELKQIPTVQKGADPIPQTPASKK